ncbi:MAG: FAD-dependent oxidoreductase [Anaerolineae bacterium]|nr:FAD-dependent oxidoreductase [Anaerolineae bacterium]
MRTTRSISHSEAIAESRRCLGCYDAPCRQACPAKVNIPEFITRIREDAIQGAGELLYEACPLAATCGLACPTTTLCEGACVLQGIGQPPVRIGSLQTFAAMQYRGNDDEVGSGNGCRVAVVGAGPSSLGCAVALRRQGHTVDVYERGGDLGGLVGRVIPAHRLPQEAVDFDLERLQRLGITFYFQQNIGNAEAESLLADYDAVFLGVGLSGVNELDMPGSGLAGVISAMDFLAQARRHYRGEAEKPETGRRVAVIGGGNVALDAAVMAKHLGAERVMVLYRRGIDEMPGWRSEYSEAASLGVEFRWLSVIDEFLQAGGRVRGVTVRGMRYSAGKGDGRRGVEADPDAPLYELPLDQVIPALGQSLDEGIADCFGIERAANGTLMTGEGGWRTSKPGLFAAGECVNGGSTIVACLAEGMAAGRLIHEWLFSRDEVR